MWLLPVFSLISRTVAHVFYRLTVAGEAVPNEGPVLLVANHPNSLLDPILVAAAARRPVRLLAKAPLFDDPKLGWAMRAVGAIPVYRRVDDPAMMQRNADAFGEAYRALGAGAAVGIFPEGLSHSDPSLAAVKTGAARIALGACRHIGGAFPIIPIGLVPRAKETFRSEMVVVRGRPIDWTDIADDADHEMRAVRDLTARIDAGLRQVTLNLEQWEDRPLIECAEAIWATEKHGGTDAAERVSRLRIATEGLRHARASTRTNLIDRVASHRGRLQRLGLTPPQLRSDTRARTALRWALGRLYLIGVPLLVIAVGSRVVFWLPRQATGVAANVGAKHPDQTSTWKLLFGLPIYAIWILGLTAASSAIWGILPALGVLIALPFVGVTGLWIRERWSHALGDAFRFFRLRSRRSLVEGLRAEQRALALDLEAMSVGLGDTPRPATD